MTMKRYVAYPGVMGSIDGTHIPIKAPKNEPKKNHSVMFYRECVTWIYGLTHVYIGWPGST